MAESESISSEHLRSLVERAGMDLSDQELADLLPIYDRYAMQAAVLHDLDLGQEDLAVTFLPGSVSGQIEDQAQ